MVSNETSWASGVLFLYTVQQRFYSQRMRRKEGRKERKVNRPKKGQDGEAK